MSCLQEHVVGLIVDGGLLKSLRHLEGLDAGGQRGDEPLHDIVLQREHVAEIAVETLGPKHCAMGGINEARGDAHAIVRPPHAAAHQVVDVERA